MQKNPKTGQNVWTYAAYADVIDRIDAGFTYKQIGEHYGVSATSIYYKVHRAKRIYGLESKVRPPRRRVKSAAV